MRVAAAAIVAALPAFALAQGAAALQAARDAGPRQEAAAQARMKAADAALQQPAASAPAATLPSEDDAAALDAAVDAAARGDVSPGTQVSGLAPGETYTVQRGDTLWDLSAKFLSDPWSWPKIWSNNPQISNPHWIYPGNVLRMGPGGTLEPVAAGDAAAEQPADDFGDIAAPRELADFTRGELGKSGLALDDADDLRVSGKHRIGFVPGTGTLTRRDSFVTRRELAESGVITAAFEDKLLLTVSDRAYAEFREGAPKVGATYAIFTTEREIKHPVTKQLFGYRTRIIGSARVATVDGDKIAVEIVDASAPIERGAWLTPSAGKMLRRVERRPAKQPVEGVIVASQSDDVSEIGEHHVVYVDKGTADGVQDGNVFAVLRSGDPYGTDTTRITRDASLPVEQIGSLLVVDAREHASTALVVQSARELLVGDRAVAKAAGK